MHAGSERRALVTGATGLLGRRLVRGLLARGERVTALVRGADARRARARLLGVLGDLPLPDEAGLDVVDGSLEALPADALRAAGPVGDVWHLGALLDLGEKRTGELRRTNVLGTSSVADFALAAGARHLHYVSTAYVWGTACGPCPEDRAPRPAGHRNTYERTKLDAERVVLRAEQAGLPVTVYRPGIVVGDSEDGICDVYGAFYDVVKACLLAGRTGLVLPGRAAAQVNLVPVDRVVGALLALSLDPSATGRAFHLVNPDAPRLGELVSVGAQALGLPVTEVRSVAFEDLPRASRLILRPARAILRYLDGGPVFAQDEVTARLGADALAARPERAEWVWRLMTQAAVARFGLSLEQFVRERDLVQRALRGGRARRAVG